MQKRFLRENFRSGCGNPVWGSSESISFHKRRQVLLSFRTIYQIGLNVPKKTMSFSFATGYGESGDLPDFGCNPAVQNCQKTLV
jgi:hypothetical protein